MSESFENAPDLESWIEIFVDDIINNAIDQEIALAQISSLMANIEKDLEEIQMPNFPVSSSRIIMQKQQVVILKKKSAAENEKDIRIKLESLQSIIRDDIPLLKKCRDIAENGAKMKNDIFEYQSEFQKRIQRLSLMDDAKKRISDEAKSIVDQLEAALDEENSDAKMDIDSFDKHLSEQLSHAKAGLDYLGEVGVTLSKISQMNRSILNTLENTPGRLFSSDKNEIEKQAKFLLSQTNASIAKSHVDNFSEISIKNFGLISMLQKNAIDLLAKRTDLDKKFEELFSATIECQKFITQSQIPNPETSEPYIATKRYLDNIIDIRSNSMGTEESTVHVNFIQKMSDKISNAYNDVFNIIASLSSKENVDEYLDNLITQDSGRPVDLAKNLRAIAAISTRFNVDITVERNAVTRCMPMFYATLCKVPLNHVCHDKLRKIEFYTEPKEANNYYISSDSRISFNAMPEEDSLTSYAPDSGKAIKVSYYTSTTLHEIGHSVDAKIGYMFKNQDKKNYGVWREGEKIENISRKFIKEHNLINKYNNSKEEDYVILLSSLLEGIEPPEPRTPHAPMGSLLPYWRHLKKEQIWDACLKAGNTAQPWYGGEKRARTLMAEGRVYHEAYTNDWVSYEFDERAKTGISEYQWRAPAEWFAEIYALFFLGKLPIGHPMTSEFKNDPKLNGTEAL